MPSIRHVSLVQKLKWHVTGNISPTAFAIGDIDGNGDNAFVIGNLVGELFVFKGNHPEGLPWLTCKGLGTITAVAIGDIRNWGRNSVVVISAEGLCHIFDFSGIEDDPPIHVRYGDGSGGDLAAAAEGGPTRQLTVPATPNLRPVPDHHHHHGHNHHHGHHTSHHAVAHSQHAHATPPISHQGSQGNGTPRQNLTHSSFHQHAIFLPSSSSTTPIHTPSIGSISRRGSEATLGVGSTGVVGTSAAGIASSMAGSARTTSAMLAGLIGTPLPTTTTTSTPINSTASSSVTASTGIHPSPHVVGSHHSSSGQQQQSPQVTYQHTGRSGTSNSSTTPLLRPQLVIMPASVPSVHTQSGNLSPQAATRAGSISTTPTALASSSQHSTSVNQHQQLQQPLSQPTAQQRGSISFANAPKASSPGVYVGSETPRWRFVNGRRVIEKPNLTLPVPVNINRAQIADIDGDGINELVLARTDRILHSYALHVGKSSSPVAGQQGGASHQPPRKSLQPHNHHGSAAASASNTSRHGHTAAAATTAAGHHSTSSLTGSHTESNHALSLMKLLSRTSSISTLDSNGLLSPVEDRRETTIHYPAFTSIGRTNSTPVGGGAQGGGPSSVGHDQQHASAPTSATSPLPPTMSRLVLVEKKRWALDGQIHCLSVSTDSETGMPLLLIAQPGLKFVMIDHKGNIIKPPNQVIRDPKLLSDLGAPDTPTKTLGSGDVATDIVCATYYEGATGGDKPRDIIGLMSMDGVLALHDMRHQTARVHDLDSTHKIFGFSKLNFGRPQPLHPSQRQQNSRRQKSGGRRENGKGDDEANDRHQFFAVPSDSSELDDDDGTIYGRSGERLSSLKYSPRHRREYERLKKRAKKQQQQVGSGGADQDVEGDEAPLDDHDDDDDCDYNDFEDNEEPSLLVKNPTRLTLQNDIFVGCSWSGITFFIDQDFNTAQYDFESRVCAFGAGEYAITPGKNEPCLFYVDFDDNIFVYYNFHIQLEPSVPFVDVVKADARLYQATQMQQNVVDAQNSRVYGEQQHNQAEGTDTGTGTAVSTTAAEMQQHGPTTSIGSEHSAPLPLAPQHRTLEDKNFKDFIHDSLYNVNRYGDEYRELKQLLEMEEAKKRAMVARMKAVEREAEQRREAKLRAKVAKEEQARLLEHQARVLAFAQAQAAKDVPGEEHDATSAAGTFPVAETDDDKDLVSSSPAVQAAKGAEVSTTEEPIRTKVGRSPTSSSASSIALASPTDILAATTIPPHRGGGGGGGGASSSIASTPPTPEIIGRRRGSLLIRDVLASYEGKKTPPLVLSPTATSPPSSFFAASTTAESHSTPPSMTLANMTPKLKRQSSSSSSKSTVARGGGGDDPAAHLPPKPPTSRVGGLETGAGGATTKSKDDVARRSKTSTNSSTGVPLRPQHPSGAGAHHLHGHGLTSFVRRLNLKDLGNSGRLVDQHPQSVINASDAAAFGSSGSTAGYDAELAAASAGSASSTSTATLRNNGPGSIGHSHGRPINKAGKGHFHHHHHHRHHDHHGRPLVPGARSHGVVVGHHRGGTIGRRLTARSRLLLTQQIFQRDDDGEVHDSGGGDGDDNGGNSSDSSSCSNIKDSSSNKDNAGGDKQRSGQAEDDISLTDVEHSRSTPNTSRPGSQSNSRRSSHGTIGIPQAGGADYGIGDIPQFTSPQRLRTTGIGHSRSNSQHLHGQNESNGGGAEDYDSCGMHTPSTISPMPSPGRIFPSGSGHGHRGLVGISGANSAEHSPNLDSAHEFSLAKSLLSPPARPPSTASSSASVSTAATLLAGTAKAPASTSTQTTTAAGACVGAPSTQTTTANANEPMDGRRSRAESVLSTGSDIGGGVILPDITLLSSSFSSPSEMRQPLSAVERARQEQERQEYFVEDSQHLHLSHRSTPPLPPSSSSGRRASHDHASSSSSSNPILRRLPSRRSVTSGSTEDV